jgi:hypothetical protein
MGLRIVWLKRALKKDTCVGRRADAFKEDNITDAQQNRRAIFDVTEAHDNMGLKGG